MKESDTGLAVPSEWDLVSDKQMMQEEQPLQVARCTGIINDSKYVINVKQIARVIIWWTHITVFHEYMPISSKQFLVCK
jgi:26S proteasome regulatory subunit T1